MADHARQAAPRFTARDGAGPPAVTFWRQLHWRKREAVDVDPCGTPAPIHLRCGTATSSDQTPRHCTPQWPLGFSGRLPLHVAMWIAADCWRPPHPRPRREKVTEDLRESTSQYARAQQSALRGPSGLDQPPSSTKFAMHSDRSPDHRYAANRPPTPSYAAPRSTHATFGASTFPTAGSPRSKSA